MFREKRCSEVATRAAPELRRCWYLQEDNSGFNRKARFLFSISKKKANPPNKQYFSCRLLALSTCPISSSLLTTLLAKLFSALSELYPKCFRDCCFVWERNNQSPGRLELTSPTSSRWLPKISPIFKMGNSTGSGGSLPASGCF